MCFILFFQTKNKQSDLSPLTVEQQKTVNVTELRHSTKGKILLRSYVVYKLFTEYVFFGLLPFLNDKAIFCP